METVGTLLGDSLKSGIGDSNWLRFFALMSSVIAEREGTAAVPGTPARPGNLVAEIREHDRRLGISRQLELFQATAIQLRGYREINAHWVGLELNLRAYEMTFIVFGATDWESANRWYADRELQTRENAEVVIVLVASRSVAELRRAYPNFFADIERFMRLLQKTVG